MKQTAHKFRRSLLHSWIVILLSIIGGCAFLMMHGCKTPKYGCPNMAELKKANGQYAYLKCHETGLVMVTDMSGVIICSYHDNPKPKH